MTIGRRTRSTTNGKLLEKLLLLLFVCFIPAWRRHLSFCERADPWPYAATVAHMTLASRVSADRIARGEIMGRTIGYIAPSAGITPGKQRKFLKIFMYDICHRGKGVELSTGTHTLKRVFDSCQGG